MGKKQTIRDLALQAWRRWLNTDPHGNDRDAYELDEAFKAGFRAGWKEGKAEAHD
jgi:hypothetical protein